MAASGIYKYIFIYSSASSAMNNVPTTIWLIINYRSNRHRSRLRLNRSLSLNSRIFGCDYYLVTKECSLPVDLWPRDFMTMPSSVTVMSPSSSVSISIKASLKSATWSSVRPCSDCQRHQQQDKQSLISSRPVQNCADIYLGKMMYKNDAMSI